MTTTAAHERVLARTVPTDLWFRGSPCLIFTGATNHAGYGQVGVGLHRDNTRRKARTHRVVYEALVGPIPDGLQLDHLCGNRACVNWHHLEPVTPRENNMRSRSPSAVNASKTHCVRGHEFTPENTCAQTVHVGTSRACRTCKNAAESVRMKRKRAA